MVRSINFSGSFSTKWYVFLSFLFVATTVGVARGERMLFVQSKGGQMKEEFVVFS